MYWTLSIFMKLHVDKFILKVFFIFLKESHPRCACKTYICWK